jgi:hypothetical protein
MSSKLVAEANPHFSWPDVRVVWISDLTHSLHRPRSLAFPWMTQEGSLVFSLAFLRRIGSKGSFS